MEYVSSMSRQATISVVVMVCLLEGITCYTSITRIWPLGPKTYKVGQKHIATCYTTRKDENGNFVKFLWQKVQFWDDIFDENPFNISIDRIVQEPYNNTGRYLLAYEEKEVKFISGKTMSAGVETLTTIDLQPEDSGNQVCTANGARRLYFTINVPGKVQEVYLAKHHLFKNHSFNPAETNTLNNNTTFTFKADISLPFGCVGISQEPPKQPTVLIRIGGDNVTSAFPNNYKSANVRLDGGLSVAIQKNFWTDMDFVPRVSHHGKVATCSVWTDPDLYPEMNASVRILIEAAPVVSCWSSKHRIGINATLTCYVWSNPRPLIINWHDTIRDTWLRANYTTEPRKLAAPANANYTLTYSLGRFAKDMIGVYTLSVVNREGRGYGTLSVGEDATSEGMTTLLELSTISVVLACWIPIVF